MNFSVVQTKRRSTLAMATFAIVATVAVDFACKVAKRAIIAVANSIGSLSVGDNIINGPEAVLDR